MLVKVSVAPGGVCLLYPDQVSYAMDTTSAFHTYRVETKGMHVRILVDGVLRIDHTLSVAGNGTEVLYFGDGSGGSPSRSYWDYFEYDTFADNVCLGQAPTILGTAGNDTLTGTAGPDVINGLGGNDTISGLGGDDLVCGGAGSDMVTGGDGNDRLQGAAGGDSLTAGAGDDVLVGGPGDDELFGGVGRDTASFSAALRAVSASLASGNASGAGSDTMSGIENLTGGPFADTLSGDAGPNVLRGRQGDDVLDGAAGTDTLFGDAGTDTCLNGEVLTSC
jgi:Ca2+-binding RTX toxin-like protein